MKKIICCLIFLVVIIFIYQFIQNNNLSITETFDWQYNMPPKNIDQLNCPGELSVCNQNKNKLQGEYDIQEQKMKGLQEQLVDTQGILRSTQRNYQQYEEKMNKAFDLEKKKWGGKISNLTTKNQQQAIQISNMKDEINTDNAKISVLQEEVNTLKSRISQEESKYSQLMSSKNQLQSQINNLNSKSAEQERDYQTRLDQLTGEERKDESLLSGLRTQLSSTQKQLQQYASSLASVKSQLAKSQSQATNYRNLYNQKNAEISKLTGSITVHGNNGSCSCNNYCAKDWSGQIRRSGLGWKSATCSKAYLVYGNKPISCDEASGQPQNCVCVNDPSHNSFMPHRSGGDCNVFYNRR